MSGGRFSSASTERAYYGFDLFIDGRDLDYRGPPLGYWKIPDQFSLARFDEMHPVGPDSPPRFLFFPTITSHLPFGPVPPYQADWKRLLTPDPFGAEESRRLMKAYIDWLDILPKYVGMFDYTYRWLGGYLQRPEPRESVMLWVGDHQPTSSVSGEGASWDVPVHLVTRDPALLERFVALGFRAGLEPYHPSLGGMHELTARLIQAFESRQSANDLQEVTEPLREIHTVPMPPGTLARLDPGAIGPLSPNLLARDPRGSGGSGSNARRAPGQTPTRRTQGWWRPAVLGRQAPKR